MHMDTQYSVGMVMFGPSAVGGAEKRYINYFSYIKRRNPRYQLLINRSRFETICDMKLLDVKETGVTVCRLPQENRLAGRTDGTGGKAAVRKTKTPLWRQVAGAFRIHWYYLRIYRQLERWRSEHGIAMVHGIFQGVYALTPYFFNRKAVTVISYNASSLTQLETTPFTWFLGYRQGLLRADQIDFLSDFVRRNVAGHGYTFTPERISVSPCSFIDYHHCRIGDKHPRSIAFCGRLIPYKNPLLLLEALPAIVKSFPDLTVHLMGEGPLSGEIAEQVHRLGLEHAVKLGFVNRPEEVFARTGIFVSLQETNNYPSQSLMEAMACENAVIATDAGETRLLVDENTGILIKKDARELTRALHVLLDDPAKRAAMGKQARLKVTSEHTLERFADYMDTVYRRAHLYHEARA